MKAIRKPKNCKYLGKLNLFMAILGRGGMLVGCGGPETGGEPGESEEKKSGTFSDWPLFRGDAEMQGVSPENLSGPLELAWSYESGEDDGKRRPPIEASPVIQDGIIYVGTLGSEFLALNLEDGSEVWKVETEGPTSAPAAVYDGIVYFGDTYGFVYALDAKTGEQVWQHETDGKIEGGVNILISEEASRVFIGSHDYFLYCFDAKSGEVLWKEETGNYIVSTPSIVNSGGTEAISFGGCDGLLYILPANGQGPGREVEVGSYIANSAAVRDGIAYLAHNGGEVIAIDVATGEEVWKIVTGAEYTASPAVDETHLYVAGPDKRLVAYDRVMGEEAWAFRAPRSLDASPVIAGGRLFLRTESHLYFVAAEADQ